MLRFINTALCTALLIITCTITATAEVKLSSVISDGVVLQRDANVNIWGTANPDEKVTVTFAGQKKETTADRFGRWQVKLDPMAASSEARPLTTSGAQNTVSVGSVFIGDVWLYLSPSFHLNEKNKVPMDADPGTIISANACDLWEKNNHSQRPLAGTDSGPKLGWGVFKEPGKYFRNDGYNLGLGVARHVKVPIGIMGLNGSTLESMTPPEGFQAYEKELGELGSAVAGWVPQTVSGKPAFLESINDVEAWIKKTRPVLQKENVTFADVAQPPEVPGPPALGRAPTTFYNKVIHRYTPATIRGIILQPKSYNIGDPQYLVKAQALISGLRTRMGKDLPVCFVQMHSPGRHEDVKTENPADVITMRALQNKLATLPNTTVLASYDLVKTGKSEPDAGLRAAQWVVAQVNGDAIKTGPIYKIHMVDGNRIIVEFTNIGRGLIVGRHETGKAVQPLKGGMLGGFEIAGDDGIWHEATAKVEGDKVVVTSDTIQKPVAVRYAWQVDAKSANLYNKNGFPALPFSSRTPPQKHLAIANHQPTKELTL